MRQFLISVSILFFASLGFAATNTAAAPANGCKDLPNYAQLKKALTESRKENNGGLNLDMWGTIVDRSGVICAIAFTGSDVDQQWPGSRLISAEKANTANAFSLPASALSTAQLYTGSQPGGFLFGLKDSQPLNAAIAYRGEAAQFGSEKDPLIGERIGGHIVFGGGVALYSNTGALLGGLGVSGDTSCADHNIAWRTRHALDFDYVPGGVAKDKTDQIIYDIHLGKSSSGFGHPTCVKDENKVVKDLPRVRAVAKK